MVDESRLLDMTDEQLLEIIRTHSPTNIAWEGAKAALEIKNTTRMLASAGRMERATYVILLVTGVQLLFAIWTCFHVG
jgi:hypothetical protein